MFFIKTPALIQKLFPSAYWCLNHDSAIFLSFDDGPHPHSTPQLLKLLDQFEIKATFFCLGKNIDKYPSLVADIRDQGHALGYHGYQHLSGWSTPTPLYLKNAQHPNFKSELYRPPYGRLKWSQYKRLNTTQKIIMWDIMPGDFLSDIKPEKFLTNMTKHLKCGSIVALHDNPSALEKFKKALPMLNEFVKKNNFIYGTIQSKFLSI